MSNTFPSTTFTGGVGRPGILCPATTGSTEEIFSTVSSAAVARATSSCFTTISTGEPSPLGKCSPNLSKPITESVFLVKASVFASPSAFKVKEKPAKTVNMSAVEIQILFGFRSTALPIFAQVPLNCSSTSSNLGIFGQNIHRPKTTKRAGKKVNTVNIDAATPIAPTGPNPRFPDKSLNNKTSKPAITVEPDANIGSNTPRNETLIASYRDS